MAAAAVGAARAREGARAGGAGAGERRVAAAARGVPASGGLAGFGGVRTGGGGAGAYRSGEAGSMDLNLATRRGGGSTSLPVVEEMGIVSFPSDAIQPWTDTDALILIIIFLKKITVTYISDKCENTYEMKFEVKQLRDGFVIYMIQNVGLVRI
jgi:hypothetical protein